MSPRAKLVIANVLMIIGVVPLAFFVVWLIGILTWSPGHQAIIPIMDPLGMIGPFVMSFIITAAVGGTSAAWSWDLVRANPQSRSRVALGLRLMTAVLLISPFALLFLVRFF
jgi:energy-coupling factor transporter transmembrane protein EcfT